MSMDKKFKLGMPRMFRAPFLSCRDREVPDLAQEPVFVSRRESLHIKGRAEPSRSLLTLFKEEVVADQNPVGDCEGRERIKPSDHNDGKKMGKRRKKKRASAKSREAVQELASVITSNSSDHSYRFFTSSDEENHFEDNQEGEDAFFFSSLSFSSDSTPSTKLMSDRSSVLRRRGLEIDRSVAVVKRSTDPYADFRVSMAEMIIEKQIFGAVELEKLLDCFLALNAPYHSQVIVDVFEEICEALFSNDWS